MDNSLNSTSDFLAFSDSDCSPIMKKSSPISRPYMRNQGQRKQFNNYKNRNWNQRNHNSSPHHYYNNQHQNSSNNSYRNKQYNDKKMEFSKYKYLHPSFLEDPWAHLIKQLTTNSCKDDTLPCDSDIPPESEEKSLSS